VEYIHNGQPIPPVFENSVRNGSLVIGSAGRLSPVKDFPFMVDIARVIVARQENIFFKLAGEGPERERLERLIATYDLSESFHLCGQITQMDSFYNGLDVYLNTSRHEGIPMSILEAMAHGLPVIAPRVGGIVEIIEDGVEGFLVPSRIPESFAEKCILLRNTELRQQMGKAARAKIERAFSAQAMAQEYHRLYRELAKQ
jgi:glycosyltransferase involved in cell wall biosynthesis